MSDFRVGAYIRLSKEDMRNTESESVGNQRELIKQYLNHHNLKVYKEYVDDGYSGTNFDRPSFIRMIDDIENGLINMVITKDLSRLGRNYIKSGYYIEEYFPLKKVRYVSILDNVDTFLGSSNNDIAPFKALFNDMVSKDTSRKIKSILFSKKEQGMYLGPSPYGYKKSPRDRHKLIIDRKTYMVVKRIYDYFLAGKTINEICDYLNDNNISSPSKYKRGKGGEWSYTSVYNILKNEVYTGITVQNVWTNISYKNKKRVKRDKGDWIVSDKAHMPIISKNVFNKVQNKLKSKRVILTKKREKLLLEGLVYCMECGKLLGANYDGKRWYLVCNGYKRNSHRCMSHYTNYRKLEDLVLERLNIYLSQINYTVDNYKKIKKIEDKINVLYQDRLNSIINYKEYIKLKKNLDNKIKSLKKEEDINISRDITLLLIDRITVDKSKNIVIYYKFKKPKC